jgi:hypothetical protein
MQLKLHVNLLCMLMNLIFLLLIIYLYMIYLFNICIYLVGDLQAVQMALSLNIVQLIFDLSAK